MLPLSSWLGWRLVLVLRPPLQMVQEEALPLVLVL
jgi:hypothetical protein